VALSRAIVLAAAGKAIAAVVVKAVVHQNLRGNHPHPEEPKDANCG